LYNLLEKSRTLTTLTQPLSNTLYMRLASPVASLSQFGAQVPPKDLRTLEGLLGRYTRSHYTLILLDV